MVNDNYKKKRSSLLSNFLLNELYDFISLVAGWNDLANETLSKFYDGTLLYTQIAL